MKLRIVLFVLLALFNAIILLADTVVFADDFTVSGQSPADGLQEPNQSRFRQKGNKAGQVTYIPTNITDSDGSGGAIELQSSALVPSSDVLLLHNIVGASGLAMFSYDLETDFSDELSGRIWSLIYTARSTTSIVSNADNWFAVAYGGDADGVDAGGSNDAFTFGVRTNGEWLLWYKDTLHQQHFISGGIEGYTPQQQYAVRITAKDYNTSMDLTIDVVPLNGSMQNITTDLSVGRSTDFGFFEFRVAAFSGGVAGEVIDARLDNLRLFLHD